MSAERIGEDARLVIDLKLEPREPRRFGRVGADGVRGIVKRLDLRDRDTRADDREHQADCAELCTMKEENRDGHHHRRRDQPELWIDREVCMQRNAENKADRGNQRRPARTTQRLHGELVDLAPARKCAGEITAPVRDCEIFFCALISTPG